MKTRMIAVALLFASTVALASVHQPPVYQAKFMLPYEVRWEGMVLAPGEYALALDSAASGRITLVGHDGIAHTLQKAAARHAGATESTLLVAQRAGVRSIDSIYISSLNLVLNYGPRRHARAHGRRRHTERVPIQWTPFGACPENCLG